MFNLKIQEVDLILIKDNQYIKSQKVKYKILQICLIV